jgi:hypothetical protein
MKLRFEQDVEMFRCNLVEQGLVKQGLEKVVPSICDNAISVLISRDSTYRACNVVVLIAVKYF